MFFLFILFIIAIIGLIIFSVMRLGRKRHEWYLQIFLSKEDFISQFFFLFAISFLGITLLAFNKDFAEPLSWRTILLFTSIVGLAIGYYFKVIYPLAVSLIGLVSWWGAQAIEWALKSERTKEIVIKDSALFFGLSLIALLFYLIGRFYEKDRRSKRLGLVYLILGLLFVTGALFFFSTKEGLTLFEHMTKGTLFFASWQITLSIFLFFIALLGMLFYGFSQKFIFSSEALAILLLIILFGVIALLPEQTMFLKQRGYYRVAGLSSTGILWAIIFNILIFLELVGIIFLGYLKRENWLVNLGVFFIFILIFVKYFDWFFAFLDKSIFFIGAGILLLVLGWFMEKGRRYMISRIKSEIIAKIQ